MLELGAAALVAGILSSAVLFFFRKTPWAGRKVAPAVIPLSFALTLTYPYLAAGISYPACVFILIALALVCALAANGFENWVDKKSRRRTGAPAGRKTAERKFIDRAAAEEIIALAGACRAYLQKIGFPLGNKPAGEKTESLPKETARLMQSAAEAAAPPSPACTAEEKVTTEDFYQGEPDLSSAGLGEPFSVGTIPPPKGGEKETPTGPERLLFFSRELPDGVFLPANEPVIARFIKEGFARKEEGDLAGAARCFMNACKLARTNKLRAVLLLELSKIYRDAGQNAQAAAVLQLLQQRWPQLFSSRYRE